MIKRIAAAAALTIAATTASAKNCASTGDVYAILDQKFQEQRIFVGAMPEGLVEVWGNPKTESWTMIATAPNGISCVMGEGVGFDFAAPGEPA